MRRIILATLATGSLLSGTHVVLAECQTLAQARGSNPGAHLAYRLVDGAHCWFAGYPSHRDQPLGKKTEQLAPSSAAHQSDESPPAGAPADAGHKPERATVAPLPGPVENAQSPRRIAGAFDVVEFDTHAVRSPPWQILGLADSNVALSQPRPPARPRAPPLRSAARYPTLVVWLLLTVGIGTMLISMLKFYRDGLNAPRVPHTRSRPRVQRLRMRDDASAAAPLVDFVETRIFDRDGMFGSAPALPLPACGERVGVRGRLHKT